MLTYTELVAGFKQMGLQAGDTVLVHSSYKSLGGVEGGPQVVINALLDVLGPDGSASHPVEGSASHPVEGSASHPVEGTLVMPTFNFDFNKGQPWDVRNTPSQMGVLTELVRTDPRAKRVFHPIYSFSIIGKYADEMTRERYKSCYERKSVFGKLRDLDGKIMIIGLSYNHSLTFVHHVEEMEGVDYRYKKAFTGPVTDENGVTTTDTFYMLVRDLDKGVLTAVDPMGALLEERGVAISQRIGDADVKLMQANEAYAFIATEMRRDPFLLYQIQK